MPRNLIAIAIAAFAAFASPAAAEELPASPDYGTMIRQQMERQQAHRNSYAEQMARVIADTIASPGFTESHDRYREAGGQLTLQQYAFAFVMTRGFANRGMSPEDAYRYAVSQFRDDRRAPQPVTSRPTLAMGSTALYYMPDGRQVILTYVAPNVVQREPTTGLAYVMTPEGRALLWTGSDLRELARVPEPWSYGRPSTLRDFPR